MTRRPLTLVRFGAPTSEDEIDLGSGAFVLFPRLAASLREEPESGIGAAEPSTAGDLESDLATTTTAGVTDEGMVYRLSVLADASQLFRLFPALQNLADKAARFAARVEIEAEAKEPFEDMASKRSGGATRRGWRRGTDLLRVVGCRAR